MRVRWEARLSSTDEDVAIAVLTALAPPAVDTSATVEAATVDTE